MRTLLCLVVGLLGILHAEPPQVSVTNIRRVFHNGEHNAFTDLVRSKGALYHGDLHGRTQSQKLTPGSPTRRRFFEDSLMAAAVIALPKTLMGRDDQDLDRANKVGALLVELKAHEDAQDTWERTKHYLAEAESISTRPSSLSASISASMVTRKPSSTTPPRMRCSPASIVHRLWCQS